MLNVLVLISIFLAVACPGDGPRSPVGGFAIMSGVGRGEAQSGGGEIQSYIFATYAESDEQLTHVYVLAESIREFGGSYSDAAIWVYTPEGHFRPSDEDMVESLRDLQVEVKSSPVPEAALQFYYAGKVFAAARAESEAEGRAEVLIWLDEDTVILQEPLDFKLRADISFAYRPVMHNRSGSLHGEPPDEFWGRIYDKLEIQEELLFAMITPADKEKIRAYFNAGMLVVRPGKEILRHWAESFQALYSDSLLVEMAKKDITKRIFLHQTALVSAVKLLQEGEMLELSDNYNYPMFFKVMYGGLEEFDRIDEVVTLRYDVYFRNPDPNWAEKLRGPADKIAWLKARLGK